VANRLELADDQETLSRFLQVSAPKAPKPATQAMRTPTWNNCAAYSRKLQWDRCIEVHDAIAAKPPKAKPAGK
jgi:hypothetical protein